MPNHVGTVAEVIILGRNTLTEVPPDQNGRVSISSLRQYVERCASCPVKVRKGRLDIAYTRGMIQRYRSSVVISICSDLNVCWSRFVICKELMHVMVDVEDESFTTDIVEQLSCMLFGSQMHNAKVTSEGYAFVAALEYMLPHNHRPSQCEDAA